MGPWRPTVQALAIGICGAALAALLHFPAPWLTGPALAVTLAALAGVDVAIPGILRHGCFVVIGMTMGAGVTPETLATARQWPAAILILCAGLIVIMAVSTAALQRLFGLDRITALLSSTPGHLSYVLSLSTETKADTVTVSIIQSIRVLTLTLAVPVVVVMGFSGDQAPLVIAAQSMTAFGLVVTAIVAVIVGGVMLWLNLPAAFLIGALVVSAALHATEAVHGVMPAWLTIPAFTLMGTLIGTRFNGTSWPAVWRALKASTMVTGTAIAVSSALAFVVAAWIGVPPEHVLIAFAPGGLETMAAMGVLLGANPAFVAAHHVSRIMFLTLLMPLVMALYARRKPHDNSS